VFGPARRGKSLYHFSLQWKSGRDVGCGPDYVSAAAAAGGAIPRGLDFSKKLIRIAHRMSGNKISGGDAQHLSSFELSFDRVLANFTLLRTAGLE